MQSGKKWFRGIEMYRMLLQQFRRRGNEYIRRREKQIRRQESLKVDLPVTLLKIMALSEKSSEHDLREYYFMYETSIYVNAHSAF